MVYNSFMRYGCAVGVVGEFIFCAGEGLMTTMAYIGCGVAVLFFIFLAIWHRIKNPLGYNQCRHRSNAKPPVRTLKRRDTRSSYPPPSDKQPRLSYNARMYIAIFASCFVIFPLFIGVSVLVLSPLNDLMKASEFSEDEMRFVGCCFLLIMSMLWLISVHTVCICNNKLLPKYSVLGKVCQKRTVTEYKSTHKHSNMDFATGYFWRNFFGGQIELCVITLSQEDGYSDFYVPQTVYDNLREHDSVEVIYHDVAQYHIVVDCSLLDHLHIAEPKWPWPPLADTWKRGSE